MKHSPIGVIKVVTMAMMTIAEKRLATMGGVGSGCEKSGIQ
jgi:hypothetical protein